MILVLRFSNDDGDDDDYDEDYLYKRGLTIQKKKKKKVQEWSNWLAVADCGIYYIFFVNE